MNPTNLGPLIPLSVCIVEKKFIFILENTYMERRKWEMEKEGWKSYMNGYLLAE